MTSLEFLIDWEYLSEASPEERACFGALGIKHENAWLTEGDDALVNRTRTMPFLSGYHLAEWFAWNWWRISTEPRSAVDGWGSAHCVASIGHGYIWPNLTIWSDGYRTALVSRPTEARAQTPFRYITQHAAILPTVEFIKVVDGFIVKILDRLRDEKLGKTNLANIWDDLNCERADEERSMFRKLEALLGQDPDECDPSQVEALINLGEHLGTSAAQELAADHKHAQNLFSSQTINDAANNFGFKISSDDAVKLYNFEAILTGADPAWKQGAKAAQILRKQEHLGDAPLKNSRLCALAGVSKSAVNQTNRVSPLSFILTGDGGGDHLALRSKWDVGRRFDVARLLGDRLLSSTPERLTPATPVGTYRQQMQRAFAAELLCPIEALTAELCDDFSSESRQEAANKFQVSELAVRTTLINHRILDRDELSNDFDAVA